MTVAIFVGDCRQRLRDLPDASVHTVVTSPPYYGLRDYQTASWEGGDAGCDHQGAPMRTAANLNANWDGGRDIKNADRREFFREVCGRCGARRVDRQIGLESTPTEFVAAMVEVFREVWRVLRPDGTVWLNLGDSYAGARSGPDTGSTLEGSRRNQGQARVAQRAMTASRRRDDAPCPRSDVRLPGFKPKDLMGIPWRVALALQDDGWWLRQEIIWAKPNPMPESVQDRCTKAHEQIFLLTKSGAPTIWRARDSRVWSSAPNLGETIPNPARDPKVVARRPRVNRWQGYDYYFDADAIAEPAIYAPDSGEQERPKGYYDGKWADPDAGQRRDGSFKAIRETRNRRSVWTVPTKPFAGAHFAAFPPELIEPCILAGSPPGGTVLDPFGGAGTTGLVADRHGRDAILLELNPDYAEMAAERIRTDGGLMSRVAVWS